MLTRFIGVITHVNVADDRVKKRRVGPASLEQLVRAADPCNHRRVVGGNRSDRVGEGSIRRAGAAGVGHRHDKSGEVVGPDRFDVFGRLIAERPNRCGGVRGRALEGIGERIKPGGGKSGAVELEGSIRAVALNNGHRHVLSPKLVHISDGGAAEQISGLFIGDGARNYARQRRRIINRKHRNYRAGIRNRSAAVTHHHGGDVRLVVAWSDPVGDGREAQAANVGCG